MSTSRLGWNGISVFGALRHVSYTMSDEATIVVHLPEARLGTYVADRDTHEQIEQSMTDGKLVIPRRLGLSLQWEPSKSRRFLMPLFTSLPATVDSIDHVLGKNDKCLHS